MNNFKKTLSIGLVVLGFLAVPAYANPPVHLTWAGAIVQNVTPEHNEYGTNPNYIYWAGVNGATTYENRTQCSSFATRVLKQAYSLSDNDFLAWMGAKSPNAAAYHDVIQVGVHFIAIENINDIQAGDIIAIKYPEGLSSTGHVMMARGKAVARNATAPLVRNTVQYEIQIIDSAKSGHGPFDTRLQADGGWDTGVGIGIFRLYADMAGNIQGYTWSTYSNSVYYSQGIRHLVVGRLP